MGEKIISLNDLKKKLHQHKIVRMVKVPDGPNMVIRFLGSSLSFRFIQQQLASTIQAIQVKWV